MRTARNSGLALSQMRHYSAGSERKHQASYSAKQHADPDEQANGPGGAGWPSPQDHDAEYGTARAKAQSAAAGASSGDTEQAAQHLSLLCSGWLVGTW
jgi:hypothetical protein